jgi:hypothetical protein
MRANASPGQLACLAANTDFIGLDYRRNVFEVQSCYLDRLNLGRILLRPLPRIRCEIIR